MAELCRGKSNILLELEAIQVWRQSLPLDDRKRFFPQSIASLLNKWHETLDRARVQCPTARNVGKPKDAPKAKSERLKAIGPTDDELRSSLAWLKQNSPDSPVIADYEQRLAAK